MPPNRLLPCDVRQGGLRDAILHSAGANAAHGLRRTNADKRRAVLMLLEDEEWAAWSDREIARRCAVSDRFVNGLRAELTANIRSEAAPRTYQDRHGNVTRMDTGRIGRKAAEPAPSVPVEAEPAELPALPELPLEAAPPSNVVRAGDRFSLVPAPAAIELDALAHGRVGDLGRIDRGQPHRIAAQGDAAHLLQPAAAVVRGDIPTHAEPLRLGDQLRMLSFPVQPHALDNGAHHNPALASMFERGERAAVEVEAAQRRGGSNPAVALASVVAAVQQPVGYPGQHFPCHLAGGLKGPIHFRFRVLAAPFGEQLARQPVEFLVR